MAIANSKILSTNVMNDVLTEKYLIEQFTTNRNSALHPLFASVLFLSPYGQWLY